MKPLRERMDELARLYSAAPMFSQHAKPAWDALANHSWRQANIIRNGMQITEVDDAMPYSDVNDMFADIYSGSLLVSRANCTHPMWTEQENVAFRIVHDVLGHYMAYRAGVPCDFSWEGECGAFDWHRRSLPLGTLRDALFTEVLGQAAYALKVGDFAAQKVAFLE